MRKTRTTSDGEKLTVDISKLQDMLSCGRNAAYQVGEDANAVIRIGRRKLYNVAKIQAYLDSISNS